MRTRCSKPKHAFHSRTPKKFTKCFFQYYVISTPINIVGQSMRTLSECQKGRVVKTTYQQFPLDSRPCQNARWVVLTPCEKSPFVSQCIVALHRNGTLSALDGYIVTWEFAHPVQHYHFDPERSPLDTYIRSKLNCGILALNGTFSTSGCTDMRTGTFSP